MTDKLIVPTRQQCEQAERTQKAVIAEVNLLIREGFSEAAVIAGMGAAIADVLTSVYGNTAVPPWFAEQAKLTAELIGRPN